MEYLSKGLSIKKNIQKLIDSNYLDEALFLINEYYKIDSNDVEIYSMEAIVYILKNNLIKAEDVIKSGLELKKDDFDLLYNLGYIYKQMGLRNEVKVIYNLCEKINTEKKIKQEIRKEKNKYYQSELKYNVILYGESFECEKIREYFNEWNIVGICNGSNLEDSIDIRKLDSEQFDFLFVVSDENHEEFLKKNNKYLHDKHVYFYDDFKTSVIEGVDNVMLEVLQNKEIEGVITGLSYAEVGIDSKDLPYDFVNIALSAQDLYYDFEFFKYIFNFNNVKKSLKYVIINLAYYSFDYDMTKTIAKYRIQRYINYFEDYHNNKDIIGVNITKSFFEKNTKISYYDEMNKVKSNTIMKRNDENQIYEATRNSQMNYKDTRKEYVKIFENYLSFLKDNEIKPIIVVCPASDEYRKYFNIKINRKKFYDIIFSFKNRYDFDVLDYFCDDNFKEDDFWDYSHLNGKGRKKLTGLLSNDIKW